MRKQRPPNFRIDSTTCQLRLQFWQLLTWALGHTAWDISIDGIVVGKTRVFGTQKNTAVRPTPSLFIG